MRRALLLAIMLALPLAGANHGGIQATNEGQSVFRLGDDGQELLITVANHAAQAVDRIVVSVPAATGNDVLSFEATTTGGFTGAVTDTDNDGQNERITLTGGSIASAGNQQLALPFDLGSATDGAQTTVTVQAFNGQASVGTATLTISFQDPELLLAPSSLSLVEGGSAKTFTVTLSAPPSGSVTVAVASGDTAAATVAPASLTFTTANWNTAQTVTVTPVQDTANNPQGRTTSISLSASNGGYAGITGSVPVFVADDDTVGMLVIQSDGSTIVAEGATNDPVTQDTFTVQLTKRPDSNVVLSVTSAAVAQLTVEPATLTFTPGNFADPQTVTVRAVQDNANEDTAITVVVTISVVDSSSDDAFDALADSTVSVTVLDDEGVGMVVVESGDGTTVTEAAGGRSDTFTVALQKRPHQNVVLSLSIPATAGVTLSPSTLIFSSNSWNVPQTVLVTALDDSLVEGDSTHSVTISVVDADSSREYRAVADKTVTVTVIDDERAELVVVETGGSTQTSETGTTDTVTVRLAGLPAGNVVVSVTAPTGEITVSPASLTFTPQNWDTPQTVTFTGVDDQAHDGHQDVQVTFAVVDAQSHASWHAMADHLLTVRNLDDERTVMARPGSITIDEGTQGTYNVLLTRAPSASVTVTVQAPTGASVSPASLTFTTTNWATPQQVTVTVPDNSQDDGDRTLTVQHTLTSTDTGYSSSPPPQVSVQVVDDDTFDLDDANIALQATVTVRRDGDDNLVSWNASSLPGEPAGVQVWRATSPFRVVSTIDSASLAYARQQFRDVDADIGAHYVVTAYYGATPAKGRFATTADLAQVPGYIGMSQSELEDRAASAPREGALSTGAKIALAVVGLAVLVAIVVAIVMAVRKRRQGDAEDDAWEPVDEPAPEPEPVAAAPAAPAYTTPQHYNLTCPSCGNAFQASGQRPLRTQCPHCGVSGVLR